MSLYIDGFSKDQRVPFIKNVLETLVGKADAKKAIVMVTGDNIMVAIINDSLMIIYQMPENLSPFPTIFMDCAKSFDENLSEDTYYTAISKSEYICNIFAYYSGFIRQDNILNSIKDIKNNPYFSPYLNLKVDDGTSLVKVSNIETSENYYLPFSSKIPKLAKADNCDITIYGLPEEMYLLVELNIFKKKINGYFKLIYRELKLN